MAYICMYCCIHNLFMHKKNMNGLSALNKTGIQKLEMMQKLLSGKQPIPGMYCCALSHPANM